MHNHKALNIWRKGIDLAGAIYTFSHGLPDNELYGLRSQMTRAGVSVPSNISEGSSRKNRAFKQFLRVALGSCYELETQMIICQQQSFGNQEMLTELLAEVRGEQKMIRKFHDALPNDKSGGADRFLSISVLLLGIGTTIIGLALLNT